MTFMSDIERAKNVVLEYLSDAPSDYVPAWDEVATEDGRVRVFITDKAVELPPPCDKTVRDILGELGFGSIPVEYLHSDPIELH
jgi:hypothetical protein